MDSADTVIYGPSTEDQVSIKDQKMVMLHSVHNN